MVISLKGVILIMDFEMENILENFVFIQNFNEEIKFKIIVYFSYLISICRVMYKVDKVNWRKQYLYKDIIKRCDMILIFDLEI